MFFFLISERQGCRMMTRIDFRYMKKTHYAPMFAVVAAAALLSSCDDSKSEARKALIRVGVIQSENDVTGKAGQQALFDACTKKEIGIAKALIDAGVDVNASLVEGKSPLVQAAYQGNVELAKVLIAAGANVNHISNYGTMSILMHAICGGDHVEMVRVLVDAGADPNFRTKTGNSNFTARPGVNVLQYAKDMNRPKVVRFLTQRGVEA